MGEFPVKCTHLYCILYCLYLALIFSPHNVLVLLLLYDCVFSFIYSFCFMWIISRTENMFISNRKNPPKWLNIINSILICHWRFKTCTSKLITKITQMHFILQLQDLFHFEKKKQDHRMNPVQVGPQKIVLKFGHCNNFIPDEAMVGWLRGWRFFPLAFWCSPSVEK